MKKKIIAYLKDDSGQTTTEYILLLAVVAAIIFRFKEAFTKNMDKLIENVFNSGKFDDLLK